MRRRYQRGSVTESGDGRYWLGKWRDAERKDKCKLLGKIREMTKAEAKEKLADILKPVNASVEGVGPTVREFLEQTFFPFMKRKWKPSTYSTNRERMMREICGKFGDRLFASPTREELQSFLDSKAHLADNTTKHLRWDLKQMFDVGIAEGLAIKNPAAMLFVPRSCPKPKRRAMTLADVRTGINILALRERIVFKLATVAGLRPGEIFGLRRHRVLEQVVDIQQRIYRGQIDTPKTHRSVRHVALASMICEDIDAWLGSSPGGPEAWLFPSERLTTPISKDNLMGRYMKPALRKAGLGWVNFLVMRRTYSTLMNNEVGADPKVVADLMGQTVDVNLNVYTESSKARQLEAVEALASRLVN